MTIRDVVEALSDDQRILLADRRFDGVLEPLPQRPGLKPNGLWYALGGSWIRWALHNHHGGMGGYVYELSVNYSNVLRITNVEEFDRFAGEFGVGNRVFGQPLSIDWAAVAERHAGIEIAPLLWERRRVCVWYYTWDVPSGCLWRPDTLTGWRLIYKKDGRTWEPVEGELNRTSAGEEQAQ